MNENRKQEELVLTDRQTNNTIWVSFILPVYNGEKYLRRTLDSIINQPNKSFEIIVINDGSPDDSKSIICEYKQKYNNIVFIDSENKGVSHARNLGIANSKGKYLLFIDQDDVLCPDSFNDRLISKLKTYENDNVDAVAFKFVNSNETVTRFSSEPIEIQSKGKKDNKEKVYMISKCPIHFSLYSNRLFFECGIRCLEEYSNYDTDVTFTHMLFYHSRKVIVDNDILLYCWVNNAGSNSHSIKNYDKAYISIISAWKQASDKHIKEGDINASRYCMSWVCGTYYYLLLGHFQKRFKLGEIKNVCDELSITEIIDNYVNCDNPETIKGLDLFFSKRWLFIAKAHFLRIKISIRSILKHNKFTREHIEKRIYTQEFIKSLS